MSDEPEQQPEQQPNETFPAELPVTPYGMIRQGMRVIYDDGAGFIWLVEDGPDALPPVRTF